MRVGILGMAFKAESDDPRESLSYKLRKVLEYEAAEVLCTDVYIDGPGASCRSRRSLERSDLLFVGAPHREYRELDVPDVQAGDRHLEPLRERGVARVKILVTGSAGFIAGYLVEELLAAGHEVVGLDNFSKYGPVERGYDAPPAITAASSATPRTSACSSELLADCDHFVAGAAIIGGISLFHELAYDLIAENERITAAAFDAAIWRTQAGDAEEDHRRLARRWSSRAPTSTRRPRGSSGAARRRGRPTASRSWRPSTSPRGPGSSTSCRTRSSGRSTASASGEKRALSDRRSCRATSSWR